MKEDVTKILSGASVFVRNSSKILCEKSKKYIEDSILRGNYVTREEYDNLYQLVLNLTKKIDKLELEIKKDK